MKEDFSQKSEAQQDISFEDVDFLDVDESHTRSSPNQNLQSLSTSPHLPALLSSNPNSQQQRHAHQASFGMQQQQVLQPAQAFQKIPILCSFPKYLIQKCQGLIKRNVFFHRRHDPFSFANSLHANTHSQQYQIHHPHANIIQQTTYTNQSSLQQPYTDQSNHQVRQLLLTTSSRGDPEREPDFQKAYRKLRAKLERESRGNLLVASSTGSQKGKLQSEDIKCIIDFIERNYKRILQERASKSSHYQQLRENKELKDCTFKPQTLQAQSRSPAATTRASRTLQEFIEDQLRYQDAKQSRQQLRMARLKTEEERELTHRPVVDSKSEQLAAFHKTQQDF